MEIKENLLTKNQYSRPGNIRSKTLAIVLHWVAGPNVSVENTRNFFESRKDGKLGYGSAHYIIGIDGNILRCIPDDELAYHCGSTLIDPKSQKVYTDLAREKFGSYASKNSSPNWCTIGIEMEHLDWEGRFSEKTLAACKELCSELCKKYKLNPETDIVTHHQVVGWKDCPRWFVNHPEDFESFRQSIR